MKKLLLPIVVILAAVSANAQCTELFFSEYVEGSHNNKALEIYNPTSQTIYLGNYRIIRWSNGSTTSDQDIRYVQSLSAVDSIPPNGTFVAILDRRDPFGTGVDTILFADLLNFGNTYNADFYSPCYTCFNGGDRVLPFNGDDAITLERDTGTGYYIVDLFGLIGERPQTSTGGTGAGWTDTPNYWDGIGAYWTKDQTLIRKRTILEGVTVNPGIPYNTPGDFNPTIQWDSLPRNTFDSLGAHTCDCYCITVQLASTVIADSCAKGNGTATVSVTGATPPYTYLWNDPMSQTTATASNLTAGTYTVTVTDDVGCVVSSDVTVPAISGVAFNVIPNNPSSCGANDGSAFVSLTNGTFPIIYQWSNGDISANADSLTAGVYTIVVTDANNCKDSAFVVLSDPGAASLTVTDTIMVTCFNESDGSVTVSTSGGIPPYTFLWSNGQTDSTATALSAGTYAVTVTDSAGCVSGVIVDITEPPEIIAQILTVTPEDFTGANNGAIDISVIGGTGSYNYSWSNGDTTQNITGLTAGTYTLIITDQNNCSSDTFSFNVPLATGIPELSIDKTFTVYPNPFNNYLFVNSTYVIELIEVYDILGQVVYSKPIRNKQNVYRLSLNNNSAGVYFLKVRFKDGTMIAKKIVK